MTIMVQGDIFVWPDAVDVTVDIDTIPEESPLDGAERVAPDAMLLDITFLGMPALGEDLDSDFNDEIDDVATIQCHATADTSDTPKIVGEVDLDQLVQQCPSDTTAIRTQP